MADRVLSVVKNFEKVEPGKVTAQARFKEDLSLDSLDVVEVSWKRRGGWMGGGRGTCCTWAGWMGGRVSIRLLQSRIRAHNTPKKTEGLIHPPTHPPTPTQNQQVVMAIEEEFALEIPDNEADKISSIADAIKYITSHPQAK